MIGEHDQGKSIRLELRFRLGIMRNESFVRSFLSEEEMNGQCIKIVICDLVNEV